MDVGIITRNNKHKHVPNSLEELIHTEAHSRHGSKNTTVGGTGMLIMYYVPVLCVVKEARVSTGTVALQ